MTDDNVLYLNEESKKATEQQTQLTKEETSRIQSAWRTQKLKMAKKKMVEIWKKHELNSINPSSKIIEIDPRIFREVHAAVTRYLKLLAESQGREWKEKKHITWTPSAGVSVKIVPRGQYKEKK